MCSSLLFSDLLIYSDIVSKMRDPDLH